MKLTAKILIIFASLAILGSCDNNSTTKPSGINRKISSSISECKSSVKDVQESAIPSSEYSFNPVTAVLTVKHINAEYNCATRRVDVGFTITENTIKITESPVFTEPVNCVCPFDVTIEITQIAPGKYVLQLPGLPDKEITIGG